MEDRKLSLRIFACEPFITTMLQLSSSVQCFTSCFNFLFQQRKVFINKFLIYLSFGIWQCSSEKFRLFLIGLFFFFYWKICDAVVQSNPNKGNVHSNLKYNFQTFTNMLSTLLIKMLTSYQKK